MPIKGKKSLIIFQDKMVFCLSIVFFVLVLSGSIWLVYLTTLPSKSPLASIWLCRVLFTATVLGLLLIYVINPEKYFVWYRFTAQHIIRYTLFRHKKIILYSALPYIMHGGYMHGSYWRDYLVFANRRLSTTELSHVNHVSPSNTLIKVRCSEKSLSILLPILPAKCKSAIRLAIISQAPRAEKL